jgi:hypothetical protein
MNSNQRLWLIGGTLIIIYIVCESFNPTEAFTACLTLISMCVWLLNRFPVASVLLRSTTTMKGQERTYYENELQTERNKKISIYALAVLIALIIMRLVLGSASFAFFSFFDNAFRFSNDLNPLISWLIIGLLVGAAAGAFISGRKYRLSPSFKFLPSVGLVVLIAVFAFINRPFAPPEPIARNVQLKDSVTAEVPIIVARKPLKKRHKVLRKKTSVAAKADKLDTTVLEGAVDTAVEVQ